MTTGSEGGHIFDQCAPGKTIGLSSQKIAFLYLNSFLENVADKIDFLKSFNDDNFRPEVN